MRKTLFPALVTIALAACGESSTEPDAAASVVTVENNCLLLIWRGEEQRDRQFDVANDNVEGGAISCATDTTPTQFDAALRDIRDAAGSRDVARILEQANIPLLYIDRTGSRRELTDRAAIEQIVDEIFDERTLAMMEGLDLRRMAVQEGEGGYFELGSLWLVAPAPGERPRIMTVNHQALDEALQAVREEASS